MCLSRPHPALSLPPEIFAIVFEDVCDSAIDDDAQVSRCKDYNAACYTLMHVHRVWRDVIVEDCRFWCNINIDCGSSPDELTAHMSHIGSRPIEIIMNFSLSTVPRSASPSPTTSRHPSPCSYIDTRSDTPDLDYAQLGDAARRCLTIVRPSVPHWQTVFFWTSTDSLLHAFLHVVGNVPAPQMQTFIFCCPSYGRVNYRSCERILASYIQVFNGFMPVLRVLELASAAVTWGSVPYFGTVDTLAIRDLPPILWPSARQLIRTLTASPRLRVLTIASGGVSIPPASTVSKFVLPALQKLSISYDRDTRSFMDVLVKGTYPLLRTFNACHFNAHAWTLTLRMGIFLHITHLAIVGSPGDFTHVLPLLRQLVALETLDLELASEVYLLQMISEPAGLCPRMRQLDVGDFDPQLVVNYVHLRSSQSAGERSILKLDFYHGLLLPLSSSQDSLITELRGLVDDLTLHPELP
ncbi:hypothetical protein DFH06DRAFT_1336523 [Mycena polygramma]|nr:hypothetical protein DFH06DRAFT_1336523 [Mycena polygramma]